MKASRIAVLITVFLIVFGVRLFLAFQTPEYNYDSYQELRQVEHIKETGRHISHDPLSYGGKDVGGSPFYSYILAAGTIFMPLDITLKVLPNAFISLLAVIIFFITLKITRKREVALFTAIISGFVPIIYETTLYNLSSLCLVIPLIFFCLHFFMSIKTSLPWFLVCFLALTVISPLAFVLILSLIFYLALAKSEGLRMSRSELEVVLFTTFFGLWLQFLIHKNTLLFHGSSVIWKNIPADMIGRFFSDLTVVESLVSIGVIPFVFGVYIIYRYIFKEKDRAMHLFAALAITLGLLLWMKLILLSTGLSILGIVLVILLGKFLQLFINYVQKTKVARYKNLFLGVIFTVFFITSIVPSVTIAQKQLVEDIPGQDEILALKWVESNSPEGTMVAELEEGYLVMAVAHRNTIINPDFLLTDNVAERISDVEEIFTGPHKTDALSLLQKYNASYIYMSPKTMEKYDIIGLPYADQCFPTVYDKGVKIYKVACRLEEGEG